MITYLRQKSHGFRFRFAIMWSDLEPVQWIFIITGSSDITVF